MNKHLLYISRKTLIQSILFSNLVQIKNIIFDLITIWNPILIENVGTHIIVVNKIIIQLLRLKIIFFLIILYLITIRFLYFSWIEWVYFDWVKWVHLNLIEWIDLISTSFITNSSFKNQRNTKLITSSFFMTTFLETIGKFRLILF